MKLAADVPVFAASLMVLWYRWFSVCILAYEEHLCTYALMDFDGLVCFCVKARIRRMPMSLQTSVVCVFAQGASFLPSQWE